MGIQAFRATDQEPGFFEAMAILPSLAQKVARAHKPRSVIVLFDTSLSMQWEKLERSFQTLEATLRSLQAGDSFNVIVFNSECRSANAQLTPASTNAVSQALDFVRASTLRGGTNLKAAMTEAFRQSREETYIVLISDCESTEGPVSPNAFGDWIDKAWKARPPIDGHVSTRSRLATIPIFD